MTLHPDAAVADLVLVILALATVAHAVMLAGAVVLRRTHGVPEMVTATGLMAVAVVLAVSLT
jgi:hypothetical protein